MSDVATLLSDLAATVPPSLAPSCAAMTVDRARSDLRASQLGEPGRFDYALSAFAAAYHEPDRAALVSLWSMYYLAALIAPATAALLCRDHILPVGFENIGIAVGPSGCATFSLSDLGRTAAAHGRPRFEALVEGHVAPFVSLCVARAGLSPRVIWSNAAVILDWALNELSADTVPAARAEAAALLDGNAGACRLACPLRTNGDGTRTRRVCCLRYRLLGVASCGQLCPRTLRG